MYSRLQNEVPHPSAGRPAEAWRGMLCRLTPGPLRSARSSPHISGVESPDWTIGTRHAGTVGWGGVGVSLHPRVSKLLVVRLSRKGRWIDVDRYSQMVVRF